MQNKFLPDKAVAVRYSISRASVWRLVKSGDLPPPIKLSPGCTRWRLSDLEASEASRAQSETAEG